jgi:glycosyltransferase involved in cell wall biosynthesis
MRIGIVTSSYPVSPSDTVNAGVFVRDLAHTLAGFGHEVHVLTPRKYGRAELSERVSVSFIPWLGGEKDLTSASMRNPLTLIRYGSLVLSGVWRVGRYARARRLDALLAMWAIPSGLFSWAAWRRHGIPYGVWALGSDIWARDKYPFGNAIVRRVLKEAKFRFADGVQLARDVEQLSALPCTFVPSVRQLPAQPDQHSGLSLPPGGPHFLFIGRYERNKGPDVLIEAMRLLLDGGQRAHLHMFGVGSLETHLRKRAQGYEDRIHLAGYADLGTVVGCMRACDWLVIPSRIESIPLIFVDALQMRLPVIATEVGDLGELVRRFGVGKVIPPADPRALAAAMREAIAQPRAAFANVWEAALGTFNLHASARRAEEALCAALARPP